MRRFFYYFNITFIVTMWTLAFLNGMVSAAMAEAIKQKEADRLLNASVIELGYEYIGL